MQITTIKYEKLFSLGNYEHEKIGVEITLGEGDEPVNVHMEAVKYVEHAHRFQKEYPGYERAKQIAADPQAHTGYQVQRAAESVRTFEATYARFLTAMGEPLLHLKRADTADYATVKAASVYEPDDHDDGDKPF